MIRKLRRKFVLIMMGIVTALLLVVFFAMLYQTRNNIQRASLAVLHQSLRVEPRQSAPGHAPPPEEDSWLAGEKGPPGNRTPTLNVRLLQDGTVQVDRNRIYFIEDGDVEEIVGVANRQGSESGVLRDYGLRYLKLETPSETRFAFADISMEREIIADLVVTSLLLGGAALLLFFLVSILLARWAVRPVQEAWDRQRQFVADASHELKTPLTVILSNAEMLESGHTFTDPKEAARLENVRAEGSRMKRLVDDLLTLARSDHVEKQYLTGRADFSDVVQESILLFEPAIYDSGKTLCSTVAEGLAVTGDGVRLRQVIDALLDNARKYCHRGGEIAVILEPSGRYGKKGALLSVRSQGTPIPQEELVAIFHRFYRVDKARSHHGGFGLGLAIAQGIVEEHSGRIWAESGEGGNTFFVWLPLTSP